MPSNDLRDKLNADILGFFAQHLKGHQPESLTLP
jgi:hypothetical protein